MRKKMATFLTENTEKRKAVGKEGRKERRKRRNVNVFFMLEKNRSNPPPAANYKFAKGAKKKWQVFDRK